MINTLDIAWAAGFLEGEGTFRMTKNKSVVVSAPQKGKECLLKLQNLFGGQVYDSYTGHQIPQWQLHGEKAVGLMMTLYSLLSEKRKNEIRVTIEKWKANPISPQRHIEVFGKCRNGHDWIEKNIFTEKNGHKRCGICMRKRANEYRKNYYLVNKSRIKESNRLWKQSHKSDTLKVE